MRKLHRRNGPGLRIGDLRGQTTFKLTLADYFRLPCFPSPGKPQTVARLKNTKPETPTQTNELSISSRQSYSLRVKHISIPPKQHQSSLPRTPPVHPQCQTTSPILKSTFINSRHGSRLLRNQRRREYIILEVNGSVKDPLLRAKPQNP